MVCHANKEEMRFTSEEEMGKDDHTPIPSESPAVNFTSASLLLQLTRVGAFHVLWMNLKRIEAGRRGWWWSYRTDGNLDERIFSSLGYSFDGTL